ncbi:Global transcription regulator sge1 [Saxophila tyrrhenica]|uniref:Global transcription regulator sge1 n=1 Tax=Saxophila tyrrhenica TaxID=1690608 RepID=A0AAV9P1M5_9PEZI|nr:Global transcription regulator sge1 [Saxophila tyrrhenica]
MSGGTGAGPLVPTFHGFVSTTTDGLMLFEACLSGKLHHVPRRPHDRERSHLIKSGSIFIYEENASGIKRWTDGVAWSPSRILGNFLIYRELEKPFPPGEKKRAMKRKRQGVPGDPYPRRDSDENEVGDQITPITPPTPTANGEVKSEQPTSEADKDMERHLIGSLVDSYGFRPGGLVKKTMSITINNISHHMVSYYNVDDVKNGKLLGPQADPRLHGISIRPELYLKQNFRSPIEDGEHLALDGSNSGHPHMLYSTAGGPYAVRPGQFFPGQHYPQSMYQMPQPGANAYGLPSSAWPTQQGAPPVQYGSHAAQQQNGGAIAPQGQQTPKTEDGTTTSSNSMASSNSMSYASQYAPAFPSTYGSMSTSRPAYSSTTMQSPSYSSTAMPSPTAQTYAGYGSSAQHYR